MAQRSITSFFKAKPIVKTQEESDDERPSKSGIKNGHDGDSPVKRARKSKIARIDSDSDDSIKGDDKKQCVKKLSTSPISKNVSVSSVKEEDEVEKDQSSSPEPSEKSPSPASSPPKKKKKGTGHNKEKPKTKESPKSKGSSKKPKKLNQFFGVKQNGEASEENKKNVSSVASSDFNPSKAKYHPLKDACWEKGQRVPYLALARTLEAIESLRSRLRTVETLANYYRSVILLSRDDLLPSVYLCLNRLAPAYEG